MALVLDLADGAQRAQAAPAETVVSLTQARLSYPSPEGEVSVLRGIDIQLAAGEITAVTGPSGSGKSSLIAVIGGLEKATGGDVDVLGVDLNQASESVRTNLRRRDIGIVFQSFHLIPAMTAVQNAALPMVLAGETEAETAAARMLDRVGLGHRLTHRPSALSGGEQQRVAIARAFAASPRLVLADEPTGNLDQATGDEVVRVMFDLVRETGASMLLVTHDPALAEKCDRTIAIDSGLVRT
ncbi:MAG: ABC transporter ATP-binding protein [Alphaproteobacteria bacterium]|nr:ABC transporter ATP-binding protein [Alphaproteobacteria bacterium]